MVAEYNPALGYVGFQEYQGSPREENIDGEPRVFRTYYGPSANRDQFLRYMFGTTALFPVQGGVFPICIGNCSNPKSYPRETWICQQIIGGVLSSVTVQHEYFMEPFSYRCEPWDSDRAHSTFKPGSTTPTLDTIGDQSDDLVPNPDCGVLIEIEYRLTLLAWPRLFHSPTFVSTANTDYPEYLPDVPVIKRPTSVTIEHEFAIESRLIKGRQLEVVSYGDQANKYPAAAAGESINSFTHDDIEPFTTVNVHTFEIVMRNIPYIDNMGWVRNIVGYVNNDVWFGYPAHAVYCADASPKPRYGVDGRVYYDITYKFVARWVYKRGEELGWVTPQPSPTIGTFVYDGKVGVWNRGWWEYPIPGTENHWWPVTWAGNSNPGENKEYDNEHNLMPEVNFHHGFSWWLWLCSEIE